MDTGSPNSPDVASLLHRLRSTLARLKGQVELAGLDGHPFAPEVADSVEDCLTVLEVMRDVARDSGVALVVVIDDDQALANVTMRQLEKAGWQGFAVTEYPARMPSSCLVVIDYGVLCSLSQVSIDQLRRHPFVVVTGAFEASANFRSMELGAISCLVKPVASTDLSNALRAGLGQEDRK